MSLSRYIAAALLAVFGLVLFAPGSALAQGRTSPIDQVAFDQKLDAQIPLDLPFYDEQGEKVTLGQYFGSKPVVLVMSYYECPMLCSLVREGLVQSLQQVQLNVGSDFQVVNVSIDPVEKPMAAANAKNLAVSRYNRPGSESGWHFLVGSQDSIERLAEAVGFGYAYDETIDQYAHAAGIMVATPKGRLSHYFYGVEYNPSDLRLGLVEASDNQIGSPIDQLLLLCYQYDPATGKYSGLVLTLVRVAGVLTVIGIVAMIALLSRGGGAGRPKGPAPAAG